MTEKEEIAARLMLLEKQLVGLIAQVRLLCEDIIGDTDATL